MKIQFLGTGAAEGIPAIFCQCETCKKSRAAGGKNLRTRSQAIIDDKILIDLPADTYAHSLAYNIDLSKIKTCIITHDHGDHLYPLEIANRRVGFAYLDEEFPLDIYCTHPSYAKLMEVHLRVRGDEQERIKLNKIKAFDVIEAEGYKITALKAHHSENCEPVFYLIQKDNQSLLYAHDTGVFPDETWEYLKETGVKFDFVTLDCTFSMQPWTEGGHMTLKSDVIVKEKMLALGLADESTIFVCNHFTHNGKGTYDEIKPEAEKLGFITSYDGMTIEF